MAPAGGSVWVVGNPGGVTFPWLVSEFVWVSGAGSRAFRVAAGSVCDGAGGALLARALAPGGKTLVRVVVDSEFCFPSVHLYQNGRLLIGRCRMFFAKHTL